MSEFDPKVDFHVGGLSWQQSFLWIMREDFMDFEAENVAFQNSLVTGSRAVNLV